jgi:hypothetical protein
MLEGLYSSTGLTGCWRVWHSGIHVQYIYAVVGNVTVTPLLSYITSHFFVGTSKVVITVFLMSFVLFFQKC